jgi:dTDP-4-amino-4,6-dideoxygalactose transaminase
LIRLFDNEAQLAPLQDEVSARVADVLEHRRFIFGPELQAFEVELAQYLGVRHVVGVANGTDAITIALRALGVGPGDEVIVPSFTFYATVEAVVTAGATPVFCDVDPCTRNVTPETVRAAFASHTKAIVAVDLFGSPAPVPELRALGVPVLEDAAQAAGASLGGVPAGALGDAATLSFYPSKNLPCFGDGGAVMTNDDEIAERARTLRFHGSRDKQTFTEVGYNSRLDELQAAILRVMLPHLDRWSEGRRATADGYTNAGLGEHVTLPLVLEGAQAAWHLYVVAHPRADQLIAHLGEHGIESRPYYRTPTHRQPAMAAFPSGDLPGTDEIARTNLALPMSPGLQPAQIEAVVAAVARACAQRG